MNHLQHVLVVKLGGGAGLDVARCADDLAQLAQVRPLVVVHGVSDVMNRLCGERGVTVRTLVSPDGHESRYTDAPTRDLFVEAVNIVNAQLRQALLARGVNSVPVTDAIIGTRKTAIRALVNGRVVMVRDDYTGSIHSVNPQPIVQALQQGLVPVMTPMATSPDGYLNVDGDRASASVASAIGAAELVILSNVRGLYRDYPNENSLIPRVGRTELEQAMGWAQGRMKRKVLGAQEAIHGGVNRVVIADGRIETPIMSALQGAGTEFVA